MLIDWRDPAELGSVAAGISRRSRDEVGRREPGRCGAAHDEAIGVVRSQEQAVDCTRTVASRAAVEVVPAPLHRREHEPLALAESGGVPVGREELERGSGAGEPSHGNRGSRLQNLKDHRVVVESISSGIRVE